jgi:hypothetical protein
LNRNRAPVVSSISAAKEIARRVETVDADIVERAAAHTGLRANVSGTDCHREGRVEKLRLSDSPLLDEVHDFQVDLFEVKAIGNHEFHAMVTAGLNHPAAFGDGHGHRFLAQDVDARLCGANRVLGVHRVRKGDVNCVHLLQTFLVFLVGIRLFQPVLPGNLAPLRGVIADNRGKFGVPLCVGESRKHGNLCDVTQTYHGVSNLVLVWHGVRRASGIPQGKHVLQEASPISGDAPAAEMDRLFEF